MMARASCWSALLDSERFRHVRLSVAINDPLDRHPSDVLDTRSESWRQLELRCAGRRAWETYRDDVLPHAQRLRRVINKYTIERVRVLQLRDAFRQWKRRSQIQTAQSVYYTLVLQHRAYYLRKALLRRCWDSLARRRFEQWRAFTDQSKGLLLALLESYERQRVRLAIAKWFHRVVRVERLEEEAFACVLVRQQRHQDQVWLDTAPMSIATDWRARTN